MAVKKKKRSRQEPGDEAVANESQEAPAEDLKERYSKLFGGGSSGGSSSLSAFLSGTGTSPASSSSATVPKRASPAPAPAAAAASSLVRNKASASSSGVEVVRGKKTGRGSVAVDLSAPDPAEEPPLKRRKTEDELHEREARTLFVGNVPLDWEKQQLRRALRTAVGDKYDGQFRPIWFRAEPVEEKWQGNLRKVGSIKKDYAKGGGDAKNAYVVLTSPEDVATVRHAVHGTVADTQHVLRADGVGEAAKLQTFDRKRSVFVGNLPASTTESDLRGVFEKPCGKVDAVRVVRDKWAKACKGFAFVRFKERPSVKAALNLWGVELQGRPIRVMKVTQPESEGSNTDSAAQASDHPAARRLQKRGGKQSWMWGGGSGIPKTGMSTDPRKSGKRDKRTGKKQRHRDR